MTMGSQEAQSQSGMEHPETHLTLTEKDVPSSSLEESTETLSKAAHTPLVASEGTKIGLSLPTSPIVDPRGTDCPSCENDGSTSSALLLPAKDGLPDSGDSSTLKGDSSSWLTRLRKVSRRQLFVLTALAYGNFWIAACISLQAPFFPQEAEDKGVTATVYGFVFSIFELVNILASPFFGKIACFVSSRVLISAGNFVAGMCSIFFGFLNHIHNRKVFIALAFTSRIIEGIGSAAVFTVSSILVTTEFPDNVATAFSTVETFFGIGLIVGPTLGGAFYEVGGFTLPFIVAGSFQLLGSLIPWLILKKDTVRDHKDDAPGMILRFIFNIDTLLDALCIISALCFIGFNSATLEPHLRKFDLSAFLTGLVFIVSGGTYAITTPFWGYLCDSGVNPRLLCVLGCAMIALSQAFIGPFPFFGGDLDKPRLWLVLVSLVACGLGNAAKLVSAFASCLRDTLKRGFPDDVRTYGLVAVLFSTCCSVGAFIGPSIGGHFLDTIGYRWGTLVLFCAEIALMTSLIMRMVWHRRNSKRHYTQGFERDGNEASIPLSITGARRERKGVRDKMKKVNSRRGNLVEDN